MNSSPFPSPARTGFPARVHRRGPGRAVRRPAAVAVLLALVLALTGLVAGAPQAAAATSCPTGLVTDESRFKDLKDWSYTPKYVRVDPCGYRMAYVDVGPRKGKVALLLHGNPTWGYYYRHSIQPLVDKGFRVIVPDLVGFGRSDKPNDRAILTYDNYEKWVTDFIDELGLKDINLAVHDWGGLLGLRVVAFNQDKFSKVLASDTSLPDGTGDFNVLFWLWQVAAQILPNFSLVIEVETARELSTEEEQAYDAPYTSYENSLAPRQLPLEVPGSAEDPDAVRNTQALAALRSFTKPFLTAYSDPDNITTGQDDLFQATIPGAKGQPHADFKGAGHYILEDVSQDLTALTVRFFTS